MLQLRVHFHAVLVRHATSIFEAEVHFWFSLFSHVALQIHSRRIEKRQLKSEIAANSYGPQ